MVSSIAPRYSWTSISVDSASLYLPNQSLNGGRETAPVLNHVPVFSCRYSLSTIVQKCSHCMHVVSTIKSVGDVHRSCASNPPFSVRSFEFPQTGQSPGNFETSLSWGSRNSIYYITTLEMKREKEIGRQCSQIHRCFEDTKATMFHSASLSFILWSPFFPF